MADRAATMIDLAARVRRLTDSAGRIGESRSTRIDGLVVTQHRSTTPLRATTYSPVVCLILQGSKEIDIHGRHLACSPGQAVIVSHDIPLSTRISQASHDVPYLATILSIDLAVLRGLADDICDADADEPVSSSIQVGDADDALIDAMARLLSLNDNPRDATTLAPLIKHEIHYRLLTSDHGATLRRLLHRNGQAARISAAIAAICNDLSRPLSVLELARRANMSSSTFHQHFKTITETTPLQYQKQLRLLEARRLLTAGDRSVSETAHEVGYRSATHFSREYARAFGMAPSDTARAVATSR